MLDEKLKFCVKMRGSGKLDEIWLYFLLVICLVLFFDVWIMNNLFLLLVWDLDFLRFIVYCGWWVDGYCWFKFLLWNGCFLGGVVKGIIIICWDWWVFWDWWCGVGRFVDRKFGCMKCVGVLLWSLWCDCCIVLLYVNFDCWLGCVCCFICYIFFVVLDWFFDDWISVILFSLLSKIRLIKICSEFWK